MVSNRRRERFKLKGQRTACKPDHSTGQVAVTSQIGRGAKQVAGHHAANYKPKNHEAIIARWTVVVGFFTFVLAIATGYSAYVLHATDETLKETLEHTRISGERQLRAYVFVEKAIVTLEGRKISGVVDLKNAGQTPAYDLTVKTRLQTAEAEAAPTFDPFKKPTELTKGILGPGAILNPRADLIIPDGNEVAIPAFKEGRGVIFLIGQAEYRDAFNRNWILNFRLKSFKFSGSVWVMQGTEEGNTENQMN